jgi:hypothetical protein
MGAVSNHEGYPIDSIDPLMLRSAAKQRVSKHGGINASAFRQPVIFNVRA